MARRSPKRSSRTGGPGDSDRAPANPQRRPKSGRDYPYCPRWLDEEAKLMWRTLVPMLRGCGMLTQVDAAAMTRYCQTWSRWKKAEEFLQKYGETYPLKDDQGRLQCFMPHPQVAIANKLSHTLTRLEQEFGLTPSSRTRIKVDRRPQINTGPGSFAEFLAKRSNGRMQHTSY